MGEKQLIQNKNFLIYKGEKKKKKKRGRNSEVYGFWESRSCGGECYAKERDLRRSVKVLKKFREGEVAQRSWTSPKMPR